MSLAMRGRHGWLLAPALACSMAVGCGDDDDDGNNAADSSVTSDAGRDGAVPGLDSSTGTLDASTDSNVAPGDGGTNANAFKPSVITAPLGGRQSPQQGPHDGTGRLGADGGAERRLGLAAVRAAVPRQ